MDNFIFRSIRLHYIFYYSNGPAHNWGWDADGFYRQNAERVNAVANMLADEKSKRIYFGIITFRQTRAKRDFPFHAVKETQYLLKELKLAEGEVYIDCGAGGNTIDRFLRHFPKYKQIVAFEPDTKNFEELKEKYGNNPRITLINAGVYDQDGKMSFSCRENGSSQIIMDSKQSDYSIQVKAIDALRLEKVSFIKMDIEGAELNALKGAEKTILLDKPKLAICIYHSHEDMVRIAEYIHNLVPEYKLYVRHYGFIGETVLYAVMP